MTRKKVLASAEFNKDTRAAVNDLLNGRSVADTKDFNASCLAEIRKAADWVNRCGEVLSDHKLAVKQATKDYDAANRVLYETIEDKQLPLFVDDAKESNDA